MKPRGVHLRRTWIHSDRRDTTRGADLGHSPALVGEEGWGRAGVACLLGRPAADQLPRPHGGLGWLSVWPPRCHHGSPVNVPSGPGARRATRHRPGGEGAATVLPLSSWRSPWRAERAPPGRERGGTSVPQRRLRRAPGWRPRLAPPPHASPASVLTGLPSRPISSGDFGPSYRPRFHPSNLGTWYVWGSFSLLLPGESATVYVDA